MSSCKITIQQQITTMHNFFCFSDYGVKSLELLELRVPAHVPIGTRAELSCRWRLGPTDILYSVKWYKDGKEFFRHVPRDTESHRKFPLPGVDVEVKLNLFVKLKRFYLVSTQLIVIKHCTHIAKGTNQVYYLYRKRCLFF